MRYLRKFKWDESLLTPGKYVICVHSTYGFYTAGVKYMVDENLYAPDKTVCAFNIIDNETYCTHDFDDLNLDTDILFIPYEFLNDKEKFLFEVSGKLPDEVKEYVTMKINYL